MTNQIAEELDVIDNPQPVLPVVMVPVLSYIWQFPATTKSDFARLHADTIAVAACLGYITTAHTPGHPVKEFGRNWKLTPRGLTYLWENANYA